MRTCHNFFQYTKLLNANKDKRCTIAEGFIHFKQKKDFNEKSQLSTGVPLVTQILCVA